MHTSTDFVLRGGCAAFADRQKMLFDQLSIAESKCNKRDSLQMDDELKTELDESERNAVCIDNKRQRRETKRFRAKESIFNRPQDPAPRARCKTIPDHHKNPHKWVRYSLDDVSNEDMTERSNTQAALSFLRQLKARREKEQPTECQEKMDVDSRKSDPQDARLKSKRCTSASQIVFKKPDDAQTASGNSEATVVESDDMPVFRSSKIILPEYQIGQRPKKIPKQKRPVVKVDRSKELKLDHLQELDEEDE